MTTALGRGTTGYRGDVECKGKLLLWRGHDMNNTSQDQAPTPTKSPSEGQLLQISAGKHIVANQLRCANGANPNDLFGSERGCVGSSSASSLLAGIGMAMAVNGDAYELTERQPQPTATPHSPPLLIEGGQFSLLEDAGEPDWSAASARPCNIYQQDTDSID